MHPHDQHLLVVRAVVDPDRAVPRKRTLIAPQEVVAQLLGALAGGLLFRWLWGGVAVSVGGGVTHPTVPIWAALCLEAGMTALLVAMIFVFVSRESLARWTALMLVPILAVLIWRGSPYTGTSLNPARSEGPAKSGN